MARRKKGRAISGFVILDKAAGIGSTDCVGKLRWAFDAQKAGHGGTLDPDATGVLAIALGEATKTLPYIEDGMKTYRFAVRFGVATDTDDASGAVIATDDLRPDPAAIAAALGQFRGDILQVPPAFSAVKLAGQRAYDLARAGQAVDLAARPLFVQRLELIEMAEPDLAILEMVCGKGGYVRSIGRDLGRALGGVAHVAWLRRLQAGPFSLDHATTLARVEELARTPKIESLLLPISAALGDMPHLEASVAGAARLRCGNAGAVEMGDAAQGALVFVTHAGQALAIGRHLGGMVHPERVFNL